MIRVGISSLGHNGIAHLEAHRRVGKSEVVALCDVNPDRLGAASQRFGIGLGDAVHVHAHDQVEVSDEVGLSGADECGVRHRWYAVRPRTADEHVIVGSQFSGV